MTAAALEARSVGMRFSGLNALTDVSLTVAAGSIHGLIGPNGAGKTTFFNCLTGFYEPTSGELWLDDQRIDGLEQHEMSALGISRTFQNIRLFSNMTALENVLVGGHAHHGIAASAPAPVRPSGRRVVDIAHRVPGLPRQAGTAIGEIARVVARPPRVVRAEEGAVLNARRLLAAVGLPGRENQVARNLAYGDQRRLEIARALATKPRLMLLDEPTAGMNPQESASMVGLIRRIRDDYATTVILIEHQMRVVMGVCERITVLDYGRKISEGTPAEVQTDPKVIEAYLGSRAIQQDGGPRAAP